MTTKYAERCGFLGLDVSWLGRENVDFEDYRKKSNLNNVCKLDDGKSNFAVPKTIDGNPTDEYPMFYCGSGNPKVKSGGELTEISSEYGQTFVKSNNIFHCDIDSASPLAFVPTCDAKREK